MRNSELNHVERLWIRKPQLTSDCSDWSLLRWWRIMLPCCYKCSWWLFVDGGDLRACFWQCLHTTQERGGGREGEGCEELLPYIEVPVGRVENLWFSLSRHFVMFYIVQLIKYKSLTKDLDSLRTSATWAAIVLPQTCTPPSPPTLAIT